MIAGKSTKSYMIISMVLFWYAQFVYISYQAPYITSLGASAFLVGLVSGAFGLTQTVLGIPIGIAADKKNRHKKYMILGMVFASGSSIIRIIFIIPEYFIVANFLSGIAAAMWIAYTSFFSTLFKKSEAKKAMGIVAVAGNGGILLGFITGLIINETIGIKYVFLSGIIAGAIGLITTMMVKEKSTENPEIEIINAVANTGEKYVTFSLIILSFLGCITQGVLLSTAQSFTTVFAKEVVRYEYEIGINSVIFMIAAILVSFYVSFSKKLSNKLMTSIFMFCLVIYCAVMPFCKQVWELYIVQIFAGISNGGLICMLMTCVVSNARQNKKTTSISIFQSICGLGMALGPIAMGALVNNWGYIAGYWFMAAIALIGFLLIRFAKIQFN